MDLLTIKPLLKKFKERFFNGDIKKYGWQYLFSTAEDVIYSPPKCAQCKSYECIHERPSLKDQDLLDHFSGKPLTFLGGQRGALAISALQNGRFKWFVVDSDNEKSTQALNSKFIPVLKKYGIEYIYEFGSKDYKCHIWFLVDCSREVLEDFTYQLFEEADILFTERDRDLELEVYPTNKATSLIRIPGGVHLRNGQINPIVYKETLSNDIEFILRAFCDIKQYSEEELKSWTKPLSRVRRTTEFAKLSVQRIIDRELDYDYETPVEIRPIVRNCQAINSLLTEIIKHGRLNKRGGTTHNLGLWLAGVCKSLDSRFKNTNCIDWFLDLVDRYRDRDADSHQWNRNMRNAPPRVAYCQTWSNEFGLCEGCPFRKQDGFISPRQIISGDVSNLKPVKIGNINLKSLKEIQNSTFKNIKNRVYEYTTSGIKRNILLASPLGSGKSYLAGEMAAELAIKAEKNVLIAVPTADLALDYRKRLLKLGVDPFILMSHENLFKLDSGKRRLDLEFDCPKYEDIKYLNDLGVSASYYRKVFCGGCPFKEYCPYPGQYSKAAEGDSKVVIIQHAHLSCRETIFQLLNKKKFDVLILDEEFIDSIVKEFKISEEEILILEGLSEEISWIERFLNWIDGDISGHQIITVKQGELETIKNKFEEKLLPWNLPEYLSHYNYRHKYDKVRGLFVFYPLPNIPVRVFTDATPPVDILKIILNDEVEVFGQDEVLNYLSFNDKNKLVQVLDSSTSKTSLQKNDREKYFQILESIGSIVSNLYKDKKVLIVTYAGEDEDIAKRYFRTNFPKIYPNLVIDHMAIGTNKFEDCLVMFQMAGVHLNSKQIAFMSYKIKSIENYWRRLSGELEVENEYPVDFTETTPIKLVPDPIIRAEIVDDEPGLYQYSEDFKCWRPEDKYYHWCYLLSLAKRQQAMRLRFHDGRERHGYLLDSAPRQTLLITESILLEDFITN